MSRAKPLPADERRQHILEAAVPLVLDRGPAITTRQIAEAAGLAEGTLFRIFANKNELMCALVEHIIDPQPLITSITAIDPELDLTQRVATMLELMGEQHAHMRRIFATLHSLRQDVPDDHDQARHEERQREREAALTQAIGEVIAPDADQLRSTPDEVAAVIRSMALSTAFPLHQTLLTPDRLADILVRGIAEPTSHPTNSSCEAH
ncbi:TetR/AcrR family transcriptional regulator [Propionibacteriaceae bacterium Y1685]|uniref:TetR/AcrR family transcriptional regulator n=1 Tax=Microlunatus sp. Y1700 TaxID=3418487 RepID=UPI003B787623